VSRKQPSNDMAALDFKAKALVQNYHLKVKYHELVSKRDKGLTDKVRLDDNLIIRGASLGEEAPRKCG
jgi:adenine-specific DNA-methyltransferase